MSQSKARFHSLDTDAIVILSSSNWFNELRSNRYHYATRFARFFPVLFVQADLNYKGYQFEVTELDAIKVLHVWKRYDNKQIDLLNSALLEAGANKPVFWIYNGQFNCFLANRDSVLNVYHATEDYFSSDSYITPPAHQIQALNNSLKQCQLLVCVSDGVAESYREKSAFTGTSITESNGCDYQFYAPASMDLILNSNCSASLNLSYPRGLTAGSNDLSEFMDPAVKSREYDDLRAVTLNNDNQTKLIAFYQGNIFDKLDYELLIALARQLPNWQFQFCGRVLYNEKGWKQLTRLPNVQYLGVLTPEQVRQRSYQATVGLIPFVESDFLVKRSFPLKAFEYLACGLPVVSIPIQSLLPYSAVMQFASGVDGFLREILQAQQLRNNNEHLALRLEAARAQDYEDKVKKVLTVIQDLSEQPKLIESKAMPQKNTSERTVCSYFNKTHFIHLISRLYDRFPNGLKDRIPPSIK